MPTPPADPALAEPAADPAESASGFNAPDPAERAAETLHLLFAVWQRKVIVLLFAGLGLVAAALYCFHAVPLYRAMATIEVAPQEQNVIHIEDVNKLALNQVDVLNTLVLKSTRAAVLERVVSLNHLARHPAFASHGVPPSEGAVAGQVAKAVKSTLRRTTRLIDVTAVHPDPQVAQLLANGVAAQFIRQEMEDQAAGTRFANVALLEEADRLKGELERSERALQNYREQNQTVSLEDRQNIVDQKLHSLAQQLNDARAELTQILVQQEQAGALTNTEALLALPVIKHDAVVAGLVEQLAQQQTLVNVYSTRYKEKYPKMIDARQRLEELKRSVALAAVAARQTLDSVVEAARSRQQGFERALAQAQAESLALSKLAIDYNILQREVDSNRTLYQALLQRLKETDVSKGIEKTSLQVIEPAGLPTTPFTPSRRMLLLQGLLGGLALGLGLAVLLARLDQSVKSVEDAEQRLGLPVVGFLVFDRQLERARKALVMNQRDSLLAEGFRSLRASLAGSARPEARQVVLFTSAGANEGKTLSASNYALALAQQNIHTVLIDLDLRRPHVEKNFGLGPNLSGVADYLLGQAPWEAIVHPSGFEKLDLIPAGRAVPNPSEHLAGPWLAELLKVARSRYDVVVLDTAPINPVSDTLAFMGQAQRVLLVVCGRYTSVKAARRAVTILERAGVRPAGLVLNRMPVRQGYYNYSYVYGQPEPAAPAPAV